MKYYGDFYLGATLDFKFTTIDAGVPTSVSGSTIAAYSDNSTTEIFAGITLTPDFDSRVGLNNVRIVMSAGNGYLAGSNYDLIMVSGTVGGKSVVGYVVGSFSIQARPVVITTGTYIANLANLDATVSSRLASASYTAPDNASITGIKAKTDNLPSDPADASDISASFTTVNTKLDDIDNFVDTEVSAIKSKTDQLTFTKANELDVNIQSVNDAGITGDGSGTPWGPE